MAMVSAGRILILPKGTWDNLASYDMLDMVTGSNNKAYLARKASVGVNPTTDDGTYWQMFGSSVAADGTTIVDDGSGNISVNIDNDTIKYDSSNGYLYVDADEIEKAFEDLTDASISSPSNGQVLVYNGESGKWENQTLTITSSLAGLTDTNISTPTNGQVLKYNSTSQKWENGADSGAVITLTVSCDSAFQGETVSITKGLTTLTETVGAGLSVSFTVPELGTWTISNSLNFNTDTIEINYYGNYTYSLIAIPDGATVTPTDDIQTLLNCANIWDKSYTTLSELLADTTTLSAVISSNNAIDYLVRSTSFAGLTVPKMTGYTTPSGEVIYSSVYRSDYPWLAFDGDSSTIANTVNDADAYIGYKFTKKIKVKKILFRGASADRVLKLMASNDNSTWTTLKSQINATQNTDTYVDIDYAYTDGFEYYKIQNDSGLANRNVEAYTIQFYGENLCDNSTAMSYIGLNNYASNTLLADATWCNAICNSTYFESVLNVKVPVMTSNNTPSGVVSASAEQTESEAYNAFSGSNSASVYWQANSAGESSSAGTSYIQYMFANIVKICMCKIDVNISNANYVPCDITIGSSNDGNTPTTIKTISSTSPNERIIFDMTENKCFRATYSNKNFYSTSNSKYYQRVHSINFYGRADV